MTCPVSFLNKLIFGKSVYPGSCRGCWEKRYYGGDMEVFPVLRVMSKRNN